MSLLKHDQRGQEIADSEHNGAKSVYTTRIFGAYGPIMFALRVWVGLELVGGEDPYVRTAIFFQFPLYVRKDTWHHVRKDTF